MLKSPNRNDLDPYNPQYDVAIDLSSKLYWSKLISILFKIRDVVYVQITNISLASRLSCSSRSLTAVTSHRLASEIRRTLSSVIILYMHLNGSDHVQSCMYSKTLGKHHGKHKKTCTQENKAQYKNLIALFRSKVDNYLLLFR